MSSIDALYIKNRPDKVYGRYCKTASIEDGSFNFMWTIFYRSILFDFGENIFSDDSNKTNCGSIN